MGDGGGIGLMEVEYKGDGDGWGWMGMDGDEFGFFLFSDKILKGQASSGRFFFSCLDFRLAKKKKKSSSRTRFFFLDWKTVFFPLFSRHDATLFAIV